MNGDSFLLDTNIVIGLFSNDPVIVDKISVSKEIYIPVIVIGELYFGATQSTKRDENKNRIKALIENSNILNCTPTTGSFYGIIKATLKSKGNPIPENDIWIAAIAKEHNLSLVTRDKHFDFVEGINLAKW
jgi:tRNA(fMet)-specific endonuclease VapC